MNTAQFEKFKAVMTKAFKMTGDRDPAVQYQGVKIMAKAFTLPLRAGVTAGDIVSSIYSSFPHPEASFVEIPLDVVVPGTEKEIVAYTIPGEGDMPTMHFESDYVAVPIYEIGFAVSWLARYARTARWDVLSRFLQLAEAGFIKKRNDDGWRAILGAAADRNVMVYDSQAAAGVFTKRLVSNMKVIFTRNGGGNSSSVGRRFMTDLYESPEDIEEMRNWGLDQVDEVTRREIYTADDNSGRLARVFGVNLHPLHELGDGNEYQNSFIALGGALASGDVNLFIGLNQAASNTFMHPVTQELSILPDTKLNDFRKAGFYGMETQGWAILDNRDVMAGSA